MQLQRNVIVQSARTKIRVRACVCVCVCAGMTRLYACTIATHSEYGMLTNYVTLKQFLQSSNAIVSKYKRNFYFLTFCLTFCAYLPCNFEDSDLIVINHVICRIIENVIINHVGFFFFFFFYFFFFFFFFKEMIFLALVHKQDIYLQYVIMCWHTSWEISLFFIMFAQVRYSSYFILIVYDTNGVNMESHKISCVIDFYYNIID